MLGQSCHCATGQCRPLVTVSWDELIFWHLVTPDLLNPIAAYSIHRCYWHLKHDRQINRICIMTYLKLTYILSLPLSTNFSRLNATICYQPAVIDCYLSNASVNLVFAMSTGIEAAVVIRPLIMLAMKCSKIFSLKYPTHTNTILFHLFCMQLQT